MRELGAHHVLGVKAPPGVVVGERVGDPLLLGVEHTVGLLFPVGGVRVDGVVG
ncbi:MAG: hypothetical protein QOG20_1675 [Pseudonocardiales bacterium]|nr:hypothetical protein [Pseudonocardiales bacterium]